MSDDGASSHDSDGEVPPEQTLVHGRARRKTAGNLMSILIEAYKSEDVQNDLVPDEEEDRVDFVASDDGGDIDLESTDESEDEGPPKEGEEEKLEGEKEIQKQERVEAKKQKRRAQDLLKMPPMRKKVKLADDQVSTTTSGDASATARPRKKSERTSWLPTAEDAPTRQSLRRATVQNKELTEVKLRESQKRSEKAHEMLRIAAEKRAADAAPALTQADRIARALETEKENSKSLNRWVQVEEERRTAQRKRMEALRNRQLDGPVVRYWSGSVIWEGDKIKVRRVHEPKVEAVEESSEKPAAPEVPTVTNGQPPTPPDAESHDSTPAVLANQQLHDATSRSETASASAVADQTLDSVPQTNPSAATPAGHASQPDSSQIDRDQRSSDSMQVDLPVPETAQEGQATPKTTDLAESQTPSELAQEFAAPTAPPNASFLDGIHYWATQSPAESQGQAKVPLAAAQPDQPISMLQPAVVLKAVDADPETPRSEPVAERKLEQPSLKEPVETPSVEHKLEPHRPAPDALHQAAENQKSIGPTSSIEPSSLPTKTTVLSESPLSTEAPSGAPSVAVEQPPTVPTSGLDTPLTVDPGLSGTTPVDTTAKPSPIPSPPVPLIREQAMRSLLTLEAFSQLEDLPVPTTTASSKSKPTPTNAVLSSILFPDAHPTLTTAEQKYLTARSLKKKGDNFLPDRPAKASCCITAKEARFRDPKTGLGYRDLAAFKSLQRVLAGGCAWSVQEGCWVGIVGDGRMGRVASGVPEGFWSGDVPKPKEIPKETVKVEEGVVQNQVQAPVQAPLQTHAQPQQTPVVAQSQTQVQTQPQIQTQMEAQPPAPAQVQTHTV